MTRFVDALIVWLGGALFVASLAFASWWYLVWLGRVLPFTGWSRVAIDAALFSVFALHHSALARPGMKARLARACPERLLRSLYVWTASALLMLVCLFWRPIGGTVVEAAGPLRLAHAAVQLAGLALIVWSVRSIDALELAGIRRGGVHETLQFAGPYQLVRHPLYLGWILIVFGAATLTGDRLVFAVISTTYLVVAIPWEERALEREFGDEYRRYRREVKARLIPFIY